MNSNDYHYLKEWIRKKNERSLKHKTRLERIRKELNKKKESTDERHKK